jgi:hypothetical protein
MKVTKNWKRVNALYDWAGFNDVVLEARKSEDGTIWVRLAVIENDGAVKRELVSGDIEP